MQNMFFRARETARAAPQLNLITTLSHKPYTRNSAERIGCRICLSGLALLVLTSTVPQASREGLREQFLSVILM